MAAPTYRSVPVLELAFSEAMDGDGLIGGSIGITVMQPLTTAGTTPEATRSITGVILPGVPVAASTAAPVHRPDLSTEAPRLLEDTLNPAAKAAFAQEHSATTDMAHRQRASLHAVVPALAAERAVVVVDIVAVAVVDIVAAVADIVAVVTGNSCIIVFITACQILKWRETVCCQQS
jgi:hypothetical protein